MNVAGGGGGVGIGGCCEGRQHCVMQTGIVNRGHSILTGVFVVHQEGHPLGLCTLIQIEEGWRLKERNGRGEWR